MGSPRLSQTAYRVQGTEKGQKPGTDPQDMQDIWIYAEPRGGPAALSWAEKGRSHNSTEPRP